MKLDKECATILVVDDNLAIRTIAKTFLENAGYTVITASFGTREKRPTYARQK